MCFDKRFSFIFLISEKVAVGNYYFKNACKKPE